MFPRIALSLLAIFIASPTLLPAQDGLYRAKDDAAILTAARAILAEDPDCALVTVDGDGQPRVRTVTASPPEEDMTIWIATRPDTRKVQQIREHDRVTLYFNDDAKASYVSIMGRATLHDDLATKEAKNFYDEARLRAFWPDYPDDFLLIEVEPLWIEVLGHGVEPHPETWRPQAVVLEGR